MLIAYVYISLTDILSILIIPVYLIFKKRDNNETYPQRLNGHIIFLINLYLVQLYFIVQLLFPNFLSCLF